MSLQITKEEYFAVLQDMKLAELDGKFCTESQEVDKDLDNRLGHLVPILAMLPTTFVLKFIWQMGLEAGIKIQQRRNELEKLEYLKK